MDEPLELDAPRDPLPEVGGEAAAPVGGPRHGPARHRRRRRRRRLYPLLLVLLLVLVGVVGVVAHSRLAVADNVITVAPAPTATVPRAVVKLAWPAQGQGAIAVPALGVTIGQPGSHPAPIASLTKLMVARVILDHLPLAPGQSGPTMVVGPVDVARYYRFSSIGGSNVAVRLGERLTELQLFQGFLVHSADNFALMLAEMAHLSPSALLQQMNATAARLGMHHTHYVEASGYDPGNVSTPADQLLVTETLMPDPVFASIVRLRWVTLPYAGTVISYTPMLSVPGVVGVKSGWTTAAGACDVLAFDTVVAGRRVQFLAATTGQRGPGALNLAGRVNLAMVASTIHVLRTVSFPAGTALGTIASTTAGQAAQVTTTAPATLLGWPGQQAELTWLPSVPSGSLPAGSSVGRAVAHLGRQGVAVGTATSQALEVPSWLHRLM